MLHRAGYNKLIGLMEARLNDEDCGGQSDVVVLQGSVCESLLSPTASHATLDKLRNFSELQFAHLQDGTNTV